MANRTKVTRKKRARFLTHLAATANVSKAAELISVSREHLYRQRAADEEFRKAWDEAVEIGTAALEDEAVRRATEGWEEPVFYMGMQTGTVRKYSDSLLMFMLKGRKPETFKERVTAEHTGANGAPLQTTTMLVTPEAAKAIAAKLIDEV